MMAGAALESAKHLGMSWGWTAKRIAAKTRSVHCAKASATKDCSVLNFRTCFACCFCCALQVTMTAATRNPSRSTWQSTIASASLFQNVLTSHTQKAVSLSCCLLPLQFRWRKCVAKEHHEAPSQLLLNSIGWFQGIEKGTLMNLVSSKTYEGFQGWNLGKKGAWTYNGDLIVKFSSATC